jgi:diguanylate cyclase (GGDEF)-like protein
MAGQTNKTLEREKRYFVRFFRFSTIGIIVTMTILVMAFISYDRWQAFHDEADTLRDTYAQTERQAIKNRVDQIEEFIHYQTKTIHANTKRSLQDAVINLKSALKKGYERQKRTLSKSTFLDHIKHNLRDIISVSVTDVDQDNHIFIIASDGTSILEPNQPELEGTNLLTHPLYGTIVRQYLEQIKKNPEGVFVDGYIGVSGQPQVPAITFISGVKELDVIIGTHVDRHDLEHMVKTNLIEGMKEIFSVYDSELIAADIHSMRMLIHPNKEAEGRMITEFPELIDSFKRVMQHLERGEHYGKITCIKDYKSHILDEKTIYVKLFKEVGIILSTGFFESDHRRMIDDKIKTLRSTMFHDMLVVVMFVLFFGIGAIMTSLLFKQRISESFDYFSDEIEAYQQELTRSLTVDHLTELGNRSCLIDAIKDRDDIALAIINIDGFNEINDFYGTDTGDRVIQRVAHRLHEHFNDNYHTVYRLHADEFAVVERSASSLNDTLLPRIKNLIGILRSTVEYIDDLPISVHISAGLADGKASLLHADMALKSARKAKKAWAAYDDSEETSDRYKQNLYWTNKVKWAIENDRIVPHFQPIFHVKKNLIEKYECLVRILDEDAQVIPPSSFLETARRSHLYQEITRIMIKKSIETFAGTGHSFSINLSLLDILNSDTVHLLFMLIQEHHVGEQIILEIVETEELETDANVDLFFEQARALGCKIAIDDFGTGYSNFGYLQVLKPDFIKIDGSLIKNIDVDHNAKHIIEVIVQYARRNNIETIAEFVSNQKLLWHVTSLGVDYAQGYFIERPQHHPDGLSCMLLSNHFIRQIPITSPTGL